MLLSNHLHGTCCHAFATTWTRSVFTTFVELSRRLGRFTEPNPWTRRSSPGFFLCYLQRSEGDRSWEFVFLAMGQKPIPTNRLKWVVRLPENGTIGFDPERYRNVSFLFSSGLRRHFQKAPDTTLHGCQPRAHSGSPFPGLSSRVRGMFLEVSRGLSGPQPNSCSWGFLALT